MPWIGGDAPLTRVVTGWDSVPVDVQLSKAIPVFTTWATRLCQLMSSCSWHEMKSSLSSGWGTLMMMMRPCWRWCVSAPVCVRSCVCARSRTSGTVASDTDL